MKKGFRKFISCAFLFALLVTILPKTAFALTFKVERSANSVKPGNDVTVNIMSEGVGTDAINAYTISLNYDSSKLVYKSGTSTIANINPGAPITITKGAGDITGDGVIATMVFNVKIDAKDDATLKLESSGVTTASGKSVNANPQSVMIKITPLGSDASLSSLKIPNATLSPKFDKSVTEYSSDIKDITSITINAQATDPNAKIMISENYKNLVKGENIIKIAVTAENGQNTKNYTIKVNLTMTPTEEEKLKANTIIKKLTVKGYDIEFSSDQKKYILTVPYKVSKLNLKYETENPNATVVVEGNKNFKVGINTVKLIVTSEDTLNTDTYTIRVTREKEKKKIVQTCPDETSNREWIMFTVSMLVTFTLGIVLGFFLCKKEVLKKLFKKREEKKEEKKQEKLSDTIEIDSKRLKDKDIEKLEIIENEKKSTKKSK